MEELGKWIERNFLEIPVNDKDSVRVTDKVFSDFIKNYKTL